MITYAKVLELFDYKNNELYWKVSTGRSKVGKKAGCVDGDGYIAIGFNNRDYKAHQLIFLINKGYIPKEIDHINGIRNDNRIENLELRQRNHGAGVRYKCTCCGSTDVEAY